MSRYTKNQTSINTLLFLDDVRNPFLIDFYQYIPDIDYIYEEDTHKITWVKSYTEFVNWINVHGLPNVISFDHDLGMGKNGKDAANFLVEYCIENDLDLPEFYCHSANPVGEKNIMELLIQFKKFRNS